MQTPKELELYLTKLDRALGNISISDKAEIITEIKSHVLEALDNNPEQTIGQILYSLGEPEQVANKYRLERGEALGPSPKHPIIKWLVIGFLGTMALSMLGVGLLIWKFSPIIQVNEEAGKVKILGGLIDINEDGNAISIESSVDHNFSFQKISGNEELKQNENVKVLMSNGKANLKTSDDESFHWKCNIHGQGIDFNRQEKTLNLQGSSASKCIFLVPQGRSLYLDATNGKIDLKKPRFNIYSKIMNGKVEIEPHDNTLYNYNLKVALGKKDIFESSNDPKAFKISIDLQNGIIEKDD